MKQTRRIADDNLSGMQRVKLGRQEGSAVDLLFSQVTLTGLSCRPEGQAQLMAFLLGRHRWLQPPFLFLHLFCRRSTEKHTIAIPLNYRLQHFIPSINVKMFQQLTYRCVWPIVYILIKVFLKKPLDFNRFLHMLYITLFSTLRSTRGPRWAYIAQLIYTGVMDRKMDWKIR